MHDHADWRPDWLTPEFTARLMRRHRRIALVTRWMRRIPLVGHLVEAFWYSLLDDGIVATLKPRWGALTFAFLNDGFRPTLYHTWRSVRDPQTPIYIHGAPRNKSEA